MLTLWKLCIYLFLLVANVHLIKSQGAKECPPQEVILPCRCLLRGADIQVWCSHSNLPKVLEGLRAIGKYLREPIDELILENNHLPSLPGKTFAPIRVMRLMLRDNGLERVSTGWLAGLEVSLMELFIVEPQLRSLPEDSLDRMVTLEAITIQSNLMKRLPKFSSLPKLRYLQIESLSLIDMSSRHFRALPSLQKLHITGSPLLTRLEGGLLQDLPKLSLVNISFCGINWMHPRAITHLPSLTDLWLVGNKITDAATVGRSIRDLPALEELHLDFNLIDTLGEAAFVDIPSLKKLFASNNKITEIHHGAFHRVPKLRMLDLNKNLVRRVHPESFLQHSGSGLEELWLVDNDISHVADLRAILDALPRLAFLDISNNNLEAIPFGAIRGHPTLERLHLDHNKIHLIDREAFMAMPALRELRLKNNSLSDALESPLWNLPALKGLDLSENYFRRIKPQFLANLPSLRKIDLSGNEISFIEPSTFLSTPALEHVNISYNRLETLHPATFRHLLGLYELDVSNNRLLEFVPGLPRGIEYLTISKNQISALPALPSPDLDLPALKMLDMSDNEIQTISEGAISSLPKLKKLYIGKNMLQQLEDGSLNGLSNLEVLDLQDNKLLQVYPNALKEATKLRELKLKNNRLNVLRPEIFEMTSQLKKIDISGNQLSEIASDTLRNTRDVQIIDASHNSLVYLPTNLHGLKHLRILELSNNHLKDINAETLRSLESLTELKMSDNLLNHLKRGAFENMMHLKVVHLDNNELEMLEPYSFNYLPSLKVMKINKNKIREIPNHTFNNLPALQVLELQDNHLKNIANNAFVQMPHLLMLNLSYNEIPGLEESGLKSVRSLEMLDLTNNRISEVTSGNLAKMEWLVELRLDNNYICSVHGSPFNGMPRLQVLSMKNNRMVSFPEDSVQNLRGNLENLDINGNPLLCSCNMLWFKAWLQESSLMGPECSEGGLLREMRLSRHECEQESRLPEPVAPGCEAELLSAPGATAQVFTPWQNLQQGNNSFHLGHNKLPPSPQESDYFYDEYVDYPYNETVMGSSMLSNRNPNKSEAIINHPEIESPHYTPGDTPTIYAATAQNKTKLASPTIPKGVSSSPSSSGFTFFGVPLPNFNLNINNLLTRGNGRMTSEKKAASEQTAERKTAIVNHPPPVHQAVQHPSLMNMLPPTMPEIQNGGFFPLLPETGGFKPIVNPKHQFSIATIEKLNITELTLPENANNLTILESILNSDNDKSESIVAHASNYSNSKEEEDEEEYEATVNPIELVEIITDEPPPVVIQNITSPNPMLIPRSTSIPSFNQMKATSVPAFNIKHQILPTISTFTQPSAFTTNNRLPSTAETNTAKPIMTIPEKLFEIANINNLTSGPDIEETTDSDQFDEIFKEFVDDVSIPPIMTTTFMPNTHPPQSVSPSTSSTSPPIVNIPKPAQTFTPLSALVAPGAQQPQYRPHGKPVITRVQSPHVSGSAPLQTDSESSNERPLSLIHIREDKQTQFDDDDIITTQKIDTGNQDISWYYINYNKTNLEPYIGPGGSVKKSSAGRPTSTMFHLVAFFLGATHLIRFCDTKI